MSFNFKYVPVLRSRQQELLVLKSFQFEERMFPMLEIIKEKDRVNNSKLTRDIWLEYIMCQNFKQIFIDLPTYIRDTSSMQDEVLAFNRTTLSNIERRLHFFATLESAKDKVIPVVSTLFYKTGEENSITRQIEFLKKIYSTIAVRTFTNTLQNDFNEIKKNLTKSDILIYDLDTAQPLNPLVKKQMKSIEELEGVYKVVIRSAINGEIQNVKLDHGDVVADADNSLLDIFHSYLHMDAFGDYAGIKKDDLNSGGTISPGFIFFDPVDNLFYGYKGEVKNLAEFQSTIVPAVLHSPVMQRLLSDYPQYVSPENDGYKILQAIEIGTDNGKSQAKFKRIAIEHYLHSIREEIRENKFG